MVESLSAPEVSWFGDRAVTVHLAESGEREVARSLERAFPGYEVRGGMASVLVAADEPHPGLLAEVSAALQDISRGEGPSAGSTDEPSTAVVRIEVHYDGEDLDDVAALLGVSVSAVVHAHQEQAWQVAMMGFAPGFGYLVPAGAETLPWALLGRRDRPRDRVDAGAVAVAAGMSAVYPQPMPGGWHVVGSTTARMFDPARDGRPALLAAGDLVRFRAGS